MTRDEWDERGRRLDAARQLAEARRPKTCHACAAPDPFPTFLERDEYECARCGAVWAEE